MTDSPWHVYILECAGNRLYTGIAKDVEARFDAHVKGTGAKFTRGFRPQRIVYTEAFEDRGAASRAETAIKRLSATQKRDLIREADQRNDPEND